MKYTYMLLFAFALCGCEQESGGFVEKKSCSFASESYLYTTFDCFHYSVDYRLCHSPEQSGCVDFAPESTMGHCESENVCETFVGE